MKGERVATRLHGVRCESCHCGSQAGVDAYDDGEGGVFLACYWCYAIALAMAYGFKPTGVAE